MPTVTITSKTDAPIIFSVEDRADAVRKISTRLLRVYSRTSVETALNKWLNASMNKDIALGKGDDQMTFQYRD